MGRQFLELKGKKVGAQVHASDLILDGKQVVYLTGFGPSQEVRAFAQLLNCGEGQLTIGGNGGRTVHGCRTDNPVMVAKGPQGQSVLYCVPKNTAYILGDSEESCREIYYRVLEQENFVLRQWFPRLFQELTRIDPTIGAKVCVKNDLRIESCVKEGLRSGEFRFPKPTASVVLDQKSDQDQRAA